MLKEGNNLEGLTNKQRLDVCKSFEGYDTARRTIQRSKQDNTEECTMEIIPDELRISEIRNEVTHEKEQFVHVSKSSKLVCYSKQIFLSAKKKEITTIVSDGCHSLAPRELKKNSQIYTCHGIAKDGSVVPLLHFVTTSKSAVTYTYMFKLLRKELEEAGIDVDKLGFLTDFEMAAIKSITEVFPNSLHAGCAFHFWLALNRMKAKSVLSDLIKKNKIVEQWFRWLKALVFFPKEYLEKTGLLGPPEGLDEIEATVVANFLKYFKKNWLEGPFAFKWNKFMIMDNRTSNLAESYHNVIQDAIGSSHPKLPVLIQAISEHANSAHLDFLKDYHHLRKQDRERREAIGQEMTKFSDLMKTKGIENVSRKEITDYLNIMSSFVTSKTY